MFFATIRLLVISFVLMSFYAKAEITSPKITYFYDGDTVKYHDGIGEYKLRITDIDAPERNQSYGKKSRRALMKLCQGAVIEIEITGLDKYQRRLGHLTCNQESASEHMIKNGHAWFNHRYSPNQHLKLIEQAARQQKTGLWNNSKPMPPWEWRKKHPHYHKTFSTQ